MHFNEAEKYLYSLGNEVAAMKLGLENISALLKGLGEPQSNYLKVQVAGTNGKGSVCAFLDSICGEAKIRTGVFTSPHLVSITERIKIDGEPIGKESFAVIATRVRETAEAMLRDGSLQYLPTFFEQITAIALTAFADAEVDAAILETGLGGRLDATTAANAEIAVITRIDLDHQEYLGDTVEKIAAEKAAIIHAGSRVVVGEQSDAAREIIFKKIAKAGAVNADDIGGRWKVTRAAAGDIVVEAGKENVRHLKFGLKGGHQIENAETAINAAKAMMSADELVGRLSFDAIVKGLAHARHPGRLEYNGKYLFDGAHNPNGAEALAQFLRTEEKRAITVIFGAMSDKNAAEMARVVLPLADRVILTVPDNPRALSYGELSGLMPPEISRERMMVTANVPDAIAAAQYWTPDDGIILVTGSLYLIGEVRRQTVKS